MIVSKKMKNESKRVCGINLHSSLVVSELETTGKIAL